MKTSYNLCQNSITRMGIILILFMGSIAPFNSAAQWRSNRKNFFIGIEMTNSKRNFNLNSDQTNLAGKHILEGNRYAVIFGGRGVTSKIRYGDYKNNQKESPLKAKGYEIIFNFQPLQFMENKPRFIEPYFTVSLEGTTLRLQGTYIPSAPTAKNPNGDNSNSSSSTCSCQCPSTPKETKPVVQEPVPYSGNVVTTRGNIGVGLKTHIEMGHLFFNLFAEAKYGIALINTSSTQALLSTYSLNQTGIDIGASIGFVRNKTEHVKIHKNRFR